MSTTLPKPAEIAKLLSSLLGSNISLQPAADRSSTCTDGFASLCHDDNRAPVLAFVANARAGAYMGGKLMMLPEGRLEEAAASGELDEVLIEALSEVFNNLTVPFNAIADNPHIASEPAEPVQAVAARAPWIAKPSQVLELKADLLGGDGRLVVLVK
ncbi:MAG TPA: hypothetical protein PKE00_15545 [Planctomycetota bacterium]|nr:hypothetical protein [Planctomycetota bacterium]